MLGEKTVAKPLEKKRLHNVKVVWRYLAIALLRALIIGPIAAFFFFPDFLMDEEQNSIHILRYFTYTVFILWEVASFVVYRFNKRWDWHTQIKKIIWGNVAFFVFIFAPLNALYIYFCFQIISDTPHLFNNKMTLYLLSQSNIVVFLIFAFYLNSISFLKSWKKSIAKNKELERQRLNYQLQALKNQINPHFLFNNLNTLSHIVKNDADLAEDYINQLGKVYRYLLQQKEKDLVPIEEELKFLESFLFLIHIRFKDQIVLTIEEVHLKGFFIAPIVLQLLIENAIKHNETSKEFPLFIQIYREGEFVVVKNDFQPRGSVAYSSGIGLANIQERYELLSDQPVEIEEDFKVFMVRIPIIYNDQILTKT